MQTPTAVVDLNALHRELHRALTGLASALERGSTLSRHLAALGREDAAALATHLVYNFTDPQLEGLGRGGLHALRQAVRADQAERSEHALGRVEAALSHLPPISAIAWEGRWLLSVGPPPGRVSKALAAAPGEAAVIVFSARDGKTGKALLCDYYKQCCEELPEACARALHSNRVVFLAVERVHTPWWMRLRALAPAWA